MSTYHRYQLLSGAQQHLYCDGCPVFVYRYQISADLQTGGRILQVRMVNMSELEISSVFLRIACMDADNRVLTTMYAVPLNNLNAARGKIFGENYTLRLSAAKTQYVQVFPERVVFSNGKSWNETEAVAYRSISAPIPVRKTDVDYDRLERIGQNNGVHNDYRYQELENAWYCTCGIPNGHLRQFCGYCGTNREWLRLNMNGRAAVEQRNALPQTTDIEAERSTPAPEPQTPPPAPAFSENASVAELLEYMNQKIAQFSPPEPELTEPSYLSPEEEFPEIDPLPPKKSRVGKVLGILLLALAIAATVGFCVIQFLMPMLRYHQANELEQTGSYAEARAIFTELGDYKDAPTRVTGTRYQEALSQMRSGDYETAYQTFCMIPNFENSNEYAADCLYSLGVLAYNDGDVIGAWDYVQKLQTEAPDYEKAEDLYQSCCYFFGNEAMTNEKYAEARSWFDMVSTYKNAAELMQYCDYQTACAARDDKDYELAVEIFRTCTYADSAEQMQKCMMLYVENNGAADDELTQAYLTELRKAAYPGAEELYTQMYGWQVSIKVTTAAGDITNAKECTSTDNLNNLHLLFSLEGGYPNTTMSIVIIYTLPDGTTGNVFLVSEASGGASGAVKWSELQIPKCEDYGTLQLKFCNADTGEELHSCSIEIKQGE